MSLVAAVVWDGQKFVVRDPHDGSEMKLEDVVQFYGNNEEAEEDVASLNAGKPARAGLDPSYKDMAQPEHIEVRGD